MRSLASRTGSFATYVTTRREFVVPKPARLDFEDAVTVPVAFLTAAYALHELRTDRAGRSRADPRGRRRGWTRGRPARAARGRRGHRNRGQRGEARPGCARSGIAHVFDSRTLGLRPRRSGRQRRPWRRRRAQLARRRLHPGEPLGAGAWAAASSRSESSTSGSPPGGDIQAGRRVPRNRLCRGERSGAADGRTHACRCSSPRPPSGVSIRCRVPPSSSRTRSRHSDGWHKPSMSGKWC